MRSLGPFWAVVAILLVLPRASSSAAPRSPANNEFSHNKNNNNHNTGGSCVSIFGASCRNSRCCSHSGLRCDFGRGHQCQYSNGQRCHSNNDCCLPNACANGLCGANGGGGGGSSGGCAFKGGQGALCTNIPNHIACCKAGLVCLKRLSRCTACGTAGKPCCNGNICTDSSTCTSGTCTSQPVGCVNTQCYVNPGGEGSGMGKSYIGDTCQSCGSFGGPCCNTEGISCNVGGCQVCEGGYVAQDMNGQCTCLRSE